MTENQKVRIQHYVPRFYLKNFSKYNGKEHYIWVFDKQTGKIFQTNIMDIAFEEEFYDKVSEEQVTEKALADLEGRANTIMQKILLKKDIGFLDENERNDFSVFIACQMIRTKETREEVKDTIKQFYAKHGERMAEDFKREVLQSMEEDSLRKMQKGLLEDAKELAKIIKDMKWIISLNKSGIPFWTSDNPITRHNDIDLSPYGNLGLTCPGFEMHIPLNPQILLIICNPISFSHEPSRKMSRDYRHIVRYRSLQTNQSTRFIFSTDNNFSLAKTMVTKNPRIKDPNRKRVVVN